LIERWGKNVDRQRFLRAMETAEIGGNSIGTLNESPLHAVLKLYCEPRSELHEVDIGGYVADIANETGYIEIQTRNFAAMKKKLSGLLDQSVVTLVYPVAGIKWVLWIDTETGEITPRRKSPKKWQPADVFYELYRIRELIDHPNFRLKVVVLELEEYKYLDGWDKSKKRNATRATRVPIDILDEIDVTCPEELTLLLPELPKQFTTADVAKSGSISDSGAQKAVKMLTDMGVAERVGKRGRRYLYEIREQ